MENFKFMECLQAFYHLNKDIPNLIFLKIGSIFLMFSDLLEKIAIVSKFHHNA